MKYFLNLLFFTLAFSGNSQSYLGELYPDLIDQDYMGHHYLVFDDELIQYDRAHRELNRFSNKTNGEITEIDAGNALKILLHYRDLTAIQFLDNRLGERSDLIGLQEVGMPQSQVSCFSYNNGVWLYDKVSLSLFRLDQNMRVDLRSGNLNQISGREIDPVKMRESGKWLYIQDENNGIVICDIYGAYSRSIPRKGIVDIDVDGENFYVCDGEGVWKYSAIKNTFEGVFFRKGIKAFSVSSKEILFTDSEGLWYLKL